MKKPTMYFLSLMNELSAHRDKSKLLAFTLLLITYSAQAQDGSSGDLGKVGDEMWKQASAIYKVISVFVLLAGIFFLGKGIIEGLRGEQGAWVKIGGALLVFGVWFFAVPSLIDFLATQVKGNAIKSF